MSGAPMLAVVAPLRVTLWVLAIGTAVIVVVIALGVMRHLERTRAARRREHVRAELEPVFARFFGTYDPVRLSEELRPAFLRMDAAHRPVAAVLVADMMGRASPTQAEHLRVALEQAGIVELGERGTRRRSPWRRALACEMLGKIGSRRSVPALLARLEDRRPEVERLVEARERLVLRAVVHDDHLERRVVARQTVLALTGHRPGWGVIPRGEAILERPADAVAPLTR